MTFRPSDDVLDEIASDQQVGASLDQYYENLTKGNGQQIFHNADDEQSESTNEVEDSVNSALLDISTEEVKAPDLSQLLQEKGGGDVTLSKSSGDDFSIDFSEIQGNNDIIQVEADHQTNMQQSQEVVEQKSEEILIPGKIPDEERAKLVSSIDGSIHSNLDFLVDENWAITIAKYKKIHRIVFRWGTFAFTAILGIVAGVMFQVYAKDAESYEIVRDSTITNKGGWVENSTASVLSSLSGNGVETLVSYGSANVIGKTFQSKSNLIKYKGIVLPQLASVDYESTIFSLEKFKVGETNRKDLEYALNELVLKESIYQRTTNLYSSSRWQGQTFQGGLIDGFSLSCLSANRAFDVVCDKFVGVFNQYGKYFNLSRYASELYTLTKELKNQHKNIQPICDMVQEYTWRSGVITSDFLNQVMENCSEEDQANYNKTLSFIEIENSLNNPELSDKVFDNSDLNAYKLLSAMQKLYNFLEMDQINEGFTESYLKFIQALIDKDRGTNKYLDAFYKDLLYVFNQDYLVKGLMNSQQTMSVQKISSLKSQIDQVNNGNTLYGHQRLLSMLTTTDIVKDASSSWGSTVVEEKTIDELFLPYRSMNDRLSVRRVEHLGDKKLRIQTEIFSDEILGKTDGDTLKATVILSRKDNLLYVDEIKIANQPSFSEVLNIYASTESATFYAMLMYIDEQIGFHYEINSGEVDDRPSLCEQLGESENVAIYLCNDDEISLYKGEVEYSFVMINGILESYTISDESLESTIKQQLDTIMMTRDNTPTIIASIVNYEIEVTPEDNIEKKLEVINQFRIHFKIIPDVYDIEGENSIFMVEFSLGEFDLQARYNIDTHLMTRISYVACDKTLEIRNLSIEVSVDNEAQLTEILNNPRIFLTNANQAAFKKYQKMCDDDKK